jgi:preprotein translocase subunit SecA
MLFGQHAGGGMAPAPAAPPVAPGGTILGGVEGGGLIPEAPATPAPPSAFGKPATAKGRHASPGGQAPAAGDQTGEPRGKHRAAEVKLPEGLQPHRASHLEYTAPADGGGVEHHSEEASDDAYAGVGRNDPCPCGSGRKFKRCHGGSSRG